MKLVGPIVACVALLAPVSAEARGGFDGADWAWSIAAGTGGAVVGGLGSGLVVGLIAGSDDDDFFGDFGTLAAVAIAIPFGADLGGTGAVYGYGEVTGHDGSFVATLAGGTAGTLTGMAIFIGLLKIDESLAWIGVPMVFIGSGVGATTAYVLSLDGPDPQGPPPTGALFELSPGRGLHLSAPAVGAVARPDGAFALSLPLLGGRW